MEQVQHRVQYYPDWEPAAKASRQRLAVSKPVRIKIPRGSYLVELVKPLHGDPYAVYASAPGIRVHDWRPSNQEIDGVRAWKAW